MDGWRRQRCDNYNQEAIRTRSQNRRPPVGSWQPTVPSWEKKFCTVVGSVPWQKLLETKKIIHLYDNVLKWNDSAGEEAFYNAKNRFWAELSGLPCEISLPDPDIYIDKIDWNSNIDPELLLDLDREFVVPDDLTKGEQVVILGEPLVPNHLFSSAGWGDAEEYLKKTTNSSLENKENPCEQNCAQDGAVRVNGWGDFCNDSWCRNEGNGAVQDSGWEDGWNNSCGGNQWKNNNYESGNLQDGNTVGVWEPWDANNRNRENNSRYMSRYKTSRFHGDDHLTNRELRNGKGRKRVNFVYERPYTDKKPVSRQWNFMNSCGPISHHGSAKHHHGSAKQGNQWSWEKQVS